MCSYLLFLYHHCLDCDTLHGTHPNTVATVIVCETSIPHLPQQLMPRTMRRDCAPLERPHQETQIQDRKSPAGNKALTSDSQTLKEIVLLA